MRKAIFLDRDGVINVDHGYVGKIQDFEFLPGVIDSLAYLKRSGFLLVLVTNQSGIARGFYTEQDFHTLTAHMQNVLQEHDASFDGVYFCPHHPQAQIEAYRQNCSCRKPLPGMFIQAQQELNIDMANSWMVGDHASDLKAAQAANISNLVLVGEHLEKELPKCSKAQAFTSLAAFVASMQGSN